MNCWIAVVDTEVVAVTAALENRAFRECVDAAISVCDDEHVKLSESVWQLCREVFTKNPHTQWVVPNESGVYVTITGCVLFGQS